MHKTPGSPMLAFSSLSLPLHAPVPALAHCARMPTTVSRPQARRRSTPQAWAATACRSPLSTTTPTALRASSFRARAISPSRFATSPLLRAPSRTQRTNKDAHRAPVVATGALLTPSVLVIAGGVVSFALSAALGANDVANSLGTAVGTGAIKVSSALIIGAVMEFSGAVLFGSTVTKTISSGVVTIGTATLTAPVSYMLGMLAVLVGCTVWMAVATKFGLPVSSTHSVVGSLIGLGVISGWGINHGAVKRIVMSWFLSPMIGGVVSLVLYGIIGKTIINANRPAQATRRFLPILAGTASFILSFSVLAKGASFATLAPDRVVYVAMAVSLACSGIAGALATGIHSKQYLARQFSNASPATTQVGDATNDLGNSSAMTREEQREEVERIFKILQVVTACLLAFSHGSNDVSNAIGPFAAIYSMWQNGGQISETVSIPPWVLGLGGLGISCGLGLFGKPVMETVGKKITKLRPTMGFTVELSTALTVLIASELGLPVSTTHTLIGCIVALGISNGDRSSVNKNVVMSIAGSWCVTLPFSALVTVVFYIALRPFLPVVPALL